MEKTVIASGNMATLRISLFVAVPPFQPGLLILPRKDDCPKMAPDKGKNYHKWWTFEIKPDIII